MFDILLATSFEDFLGDVFEMVLSKKVLREVIDK